MLQARLKSALPVLLLAGAALIAFLMVGSRPELPRAEGRSPVPSVKVLQVQKGDVAVTIVAHSSVAARQILDLSSEVAGRVVWMAPGFVRGELTNKDALLLRIDPIDYRAALADAKATLANAKLALADARVLKQSASVAEAEARVEAARQRIVQAQKNLANTEIRAPFNSVIDTQLVEFGQYVTAGTNIARLLSTDKAEIRLPVTAADRGFLNLKSTAAVSLQARLGAESQRWQGKIARIESRVDEQTRVFPVVVEVDFPYDLERHKVALPLGLFVKAELAGEPVAAAVRLPRSALHEGNSVFTLENGSLQRRVVSVARQDAEGIIVTSGLEDGDAVVVTRLELMYEGMQVMRADG